MMWQWGVVSKCSPPLLKFNWIEFLPIQLNLFPNTHIKYSLNACEITKLSLIQKLVQVMFFCLFYLSFGQFTLIPYSSSYSPCISSIVLWFGAFQSRFKNKKTNRLNLTSTLVLAFLWFKFYKSTLESCFCVDFRFYHF